VEYHAARGRDKFAPMDYKKVLGTLVSAGSIFADETYTRLHLDEPMEHVHLETTPPMDLGKYAFDAELRSGGALQINVFDEMNNLADGVSVQVADYRTSATNSLMSDFS
jgi:hypothetical protein